MAVPTENEIRDLLEGYGVDNTVLSNEWIENCRDNEIIPHVEEITKMVFSAEQEISEYYSGTGKPTLILNRRPVNEIVSIQVVGSVSLIPSSTFTLIGSEGIVRLSNNFSEGVRGPLFPKGSKNILVTYKYGTADYPEIVKSAIKNLVAAKMLNLIGARTGGGSLSTQAFNRSFGTHGKYSDIRKELVSSAYSYLRKYMTGVVGA